MTGNDQEQAQEQELTPKQDKLILCLLAGLTIEASAQQIGIGDKTARRWLKLPHVKQALHQAKQELFSDALDELRSGVADAIKTLKSVMTSEETTAASRVRAAQIWIEQAVELHKVAELEQKFSLLEEYLKASGMMK